MKPLKEQETGPAAMNETKSTQPDVTGDSEQPDSSGQRRSRIPRVTPWYRLRVSLRMLTGMKRHDFRAARTWISTMYPGRGLPARLVLFFVWAVEMLWQKMPEVELWAEFEQPVSRTPIWLAKGDPFENYPWARNPEARLPAEVDVAVVGAGLVGGAAAYHWAKNGRASMAVLEMNGPASGSAGRNEGLVVMGRYYFMVHQTVLKYLRRTRRELKESQLLSLAQEFAAAYASAAYMNGDLIEQTVREEGIDCEYRRLGWVQATDPEGLAGLERSVRAARETGFTDWTKISPQEAFERSGIKTTFDCGFSRGAATWHPAKWVWELLRIALASPWVQLYTRTRVLRVEDQGERYELITDRGSILARHIINATESHTPSLFPNFSGVILPVQTQAAFGASDLGTMKEGIGISGLQGFFGWHDGGVLFGSDATRVPDREAGANQPSRFITRFVLGQLKTYFGLRWVRVSNEWSGTVSYSPDEFPLVGSMDGKRMYIIGGMAGSGSGVSFLAARHIVWKILGIQGHDYYPEKYFSPSRFGFDLRPGGDPS